MECLECFVGVFTGTKAPPPPPPPPPPFQGVPEGVEEPLVQDLGQLGRARHVDHVVHPPHVLQGQVQSLAGKHHLQFFFFKRRFKKKKLALSFFIYTTTT